MKESYGYCDMSEEIKFHKKKRYRCKRHGDGKGGFNLGGMFDGHICVECFKELVQNACEMIEEIKEDAS